MRGVTLDFTSSGARINWAGTREGAEHDLQAAVVNAVTWRGSDKVFPTRGTMLQRAALSGRLFSLNEARHAANFAAAETIQFLKVTGTPVLTRLLMDPIGFEDRRLKLDLRGYVDDTEIKFTTLL